MSNIVINVTGSSAGDGFLIAPDNGINFTVPVNLSTNDGTTLSATIDPTPNGAGGKVNGLVFDHFGDFEGFILETRLGELERFPQPRKASARDCWQRVGGAESVDRASGTEAARPGSNHHSSRSLTPGCVTAA
jgi:hypothetical protein